MASVRIVHGVFFFTRIERFLFLIHGMALNGIDCIFCICLISMKLRCVCIKIILSPTIKWNNHMTLIQTYQISNDKFKATDRFNNNFTRDYNYRILNHLQAVTIVFPRFLSRVFSRILRQFPTSQPGRGASRQISPPALPLTPYKYKPATQHRIQNIAAMKIATLQFSPKLGDVQGNIQRADELLRTGTRGAVSTADGGGDGVEGLRPDILVLSEMALTG